MLAFWPITFFVLVAATYGAAQTMTPPAPAQQPVSVKVYTVGADATAPQLLSSIGGSPMPDKCRRKLSGTVAFSLLIDETGKPRNMNYLRLTGAPVDQIALQFVSAEQFKPGEHDGVPAVVALSVELDLHACVVEIKDGNGKRTGALQLLSQVEQRFGTLSKVPDDAILTSVLPTSGDKPLPMRMGGDISAPRALNTVQAQFSDQARAAKFSGASLLSLTVDEQGMPRDIRIVRAIGMGLDEKAIEAVSQYRFSPGMEYGVAVPVAFAVEVNFKLYASPSQHQH